jgi:hypothetical protein
MVVKQSGAFTESSVVGDYRYGYWRRDGGQHICSMGTLNFDGAGDWTATVEFVNTDGATTNGTTDSGTYMVAADGALQLTFDGTADILQGGMEEGGETAILGGTQATGGFPAKMILIRSPAAATDATFDGDYFVAGFGRVNAGGYESIVGLISADGAGAFNFNFTSNSNGTLLPSGSTSGTSGTSANGALSVDFGPQLVGGIVAAGDLAFLAGGVNTGSGPLLLFLIRR